MSEFCPRTTPKRNATAFMLGERRQQKEGDDAMPGGMPEHVAKGAVYRKLDEWYTKKQNRKESLQKLKAGLASLHRSESLAGLQRLQDSLRDLATQHDTGGFAAGVVEVNQNISVLGD